MRSAIYIPISLSLRHRPHSIHLILPHFIEVTSFILATLLYVVSIVIFMLCIRVFPLTIYRLDSGKDPRVPSSLHAIDYCRTTSLLIPYLVYYIRFTS